MQFDISIHNHDFQLPSLMSNCIICSRTLWLGQTLDFAHAQTIHLAALFTHSIKTFLAMLQLPNYRFDNRSCSQMTSKYINVVTFTKEMLCVCESTSNIFKTSYKCHPLSFEIFKNSSEYCNLRSADCFLLTGKLSLPGILKLFHTYSMLTPVKDSLWCLLMPVMP